MEAQRASARPLTGLLAALAFVGLGAATSSAAGYRTTNFVIDAPSAELAQEIGVAAEHYRQTLAIEWLGRELPAWYKPCPVKAVVSPQLGAGGATSFIFDRGEVFGWQMDIQGSRQRILDSVLPHEIMHTIFASHFRQPLPRWADEGACTTVEHRSEIAKQERMLIDFLKTRKGIAFSDMLYMKDYPQEVLPLYAQGHSLARYLIDQRGKRAFLNFLADGMRDENWPRAVREHYQYEDLRRLQDSWLAWIRAGRPPLELTGGTLLASAQVSTPPAATEASGVATAAMGGMAGQQPQREATAASATGDRQASASAKAPGSAHPAAPGRSVYGEKTTWQPAKPAAMAPVGGASDSTVDDLAAYDAARTPAAIRR
ncbi:MAG: hypothetical protein IT424_14505 [Pirellulales bacterium]|nr:hypothetical protein [Pirellulales bacterium]